MKTVFITSFHNFVSKNILNTNALRILKEAEDVRIVLFVPKAKEEFFIETYQTERLFVEGVDTNAINNVPRERRFHKLARLLINSHYLWYKKAEELDRKRDISGYLKYFFEISFTKIFGGTRILFRILRKAYPAYTEESLKGFFEKYSPDMLFATDIFDESDAIFMKESRRRGIRTLGMVRSWDNCYSKGILKVIPDAIIVNNETIKDELVSVQYVPESIINIVGFPQFDRFVNNSRMSREDFFREIGANPNKKLVLLAPAGSLLSDTDWQICDIIAKGIDSGEIQEPTSVLVRNHPNHPADLSKVSSKEHFIFDNPGKTFNKANPKETELTALDSEHLANSVYHCDLLIYTATTLGLDALVFDKPQIIIDFDGYETKAYKKSVKRYHNEDHMKKMVALGGVHVAESKEDLIRQINDYLAHPEHDKEGRERMFRQQLWKVDGKSGERVAKFVLGMMMEK